MKKLAIVITHPIQYYAPAFKLIAQQIDLMVFYTWGQTSISKHDPGFGKTIKWDIDLLAGYHYELVNNTSTNPGSHHFKGIVNPDLIEKINCYKPDAVLIYGWAYKSHLSVMRYFKNKIPVLFRGDSTLLDEKPNLKNLLRWFFLKWVYKYVDYAFYTGSNNKAYFKKYGLQDGQLIFTPHAVDNARFEIKKEDKLKKLKLDLNLNEDSLLILFAGKFEQKKDPVLLLKSFGNIPHPNVHILFVGNGELEQALKLEALQYSNVHFMDFQNQTYMPVVYQACDIFCLPSKGPGETWGLAINESMACGKAILVSDKTGCAIDLVKPGVNGYIHTAGSIDDLSDRLTCLISKGKKGLLLMGERSKEIIRNWSIEIQANIIINYINESNQ